MSLTKQDKIKICSHYDSLLSSIRPLSSFLRHPFYPNFINFDYSPTNAEHEHQYSAQDAAAELQRTIKNADQEEILDFIANPTFEPSLHVHTRVMNAYKTSLEDTILYRNVSESLIINKLPSDPREKDRFVRITKCFKINLSDELTYLLEKTLVIQDNVFNLFVDIVKRNNGEGLDYQTFYELVWQEIISRKAYLSDIKITNNFASNKELETYITDRYGENYKKYWQYKGIIKLDNRKPIDHQNSPESLQLTFKKSL